MVIPLLPAIIGHGARIGITSASVKAGAGQFAQSLPFGAGYSLGTFVGFPKNYQGQPTKLYKAQQITFNQGNKMAYGRQRIRKWFSFRKTAWYWKPTYHRKLRRTVYTHPQRRRY